MSFLEMLFISSLGIFFLNLIWKWSKSLLTIIMMEAMSAVIMASFFLESASYFCVIFIMFTFFVSEALILLSSLYSTLRLSGAVTSSLILI